MIIDKILKSKLIRYIYEIPTNNIALVIYSIRIIGNLSTNPDYVCEFLIEDGVIDFFNICLNIQSNRILKEILWTISNFFACGKNIINKIVENEDLLKNIKGLFQNTSAMVREELFYCMGNFFSNSDVFLAKKLFDLKFDEDILNVLSQIKNPNTILMILEIIDCISKIAFFEDISSYQFDDMENESKSKYVKVQNPLIKNFIVLGLFDILENTMSNCNNNELIARISLLIERLKLQE